MNPFFSSINLFHIQIVPRATRIGRMDAVRLVSIGMSVPLVRLTVLSAGFTTKLLFRRRSDIFLKEKEFFSFLKSYFKKYEILEFLKIF